MGRSDAQSGYRCRRQHLHHRQRRCGLQWCGHYRQCPWFAVQLGRWVRQPTIACGSGPYKSPSSTVVKITEESLLERTCGKIASWPAFNLHSQLLK